MLWLDLWLDLRFDGLWLDLFSNRGLRRLRV